MLVVNYCVLCLYSFARQETSCEQEDFFPRDCYVKANDNYVTLPVLTCLKRLIRIHTIFTVYVFLYLLLYILYLTLNTHTHHPMQGYHPQYSNRPDYKRNGKPVNLTNFVKTSASHINDIIIYWNRVDILYPQVGADLVYAFSLH